MKKTIFFLLFNFLLIGCSKDENNIDGVIDNPQTDYLFLTGLIPSTQAELATVKSVKSIDTNQIREFSKISDISIIIDGFPDADQQLGGSCQSWALGYYLMSYHYIKINNYPNLRLSPSFIYNQTKTGVSGGASFVKVLDFAKQNGTCTWSLMPGNPSNFADNPSVEAIKNAKEFTIGDYFKFDKDDLPQIKTYLRRKLPILIAFEVDEAWGDNNYLKNEDYIFNQVDGSYIWRHMNNYKKVKKDGNHAVMLCGYSNEREAFLIKNSWGKSWGQNGYMWIDYKVFEKVVFEAYLAVPRFVSTDHIADGKINPNAMGSVKNWGFFQVKKRGFCYSTDPDPKIDDPNDITLSTSTSGEGDFSITLQGLKANMVYYARAYASSNTQTYYGNEQSFKTDITIPEIITTPATSITFNSASLGGNITNDGGSPIIQRGVCWSTSQNPTVLDNKSSDSDSGIGSFTSSIIGLTPNTLYYTRAYAMNSQGTVYGNELSFRTLSNPYESLSGVYSGVGTFTNYQKNGDVSYLLILSFIADEKGILSGSMSFDSYNQPMTGTTDGNIITFGWISPPAAPFKYSGTFSADKKTIVGSGGAGSYYAPDNANGPFKIEKQ